MENEIIKVEECPNILDEKTNGGTTMSKAKLVTIYQHKDGRLEILSNNGPLSVTKDKKTIFLGKRTRKDGFLEEELTEMTPTSGD